MSPPLAHDSSSPSSSSPHVFSSRTVAKFFFGRWWSRTTGAVMDVELPKQLREPALTTFSRLCGIDTSEAEKSLSEYTSIGHFFSRRLRPGLRPVEDTSSSALTSPCDGRIMHLENLTETGSERVTQVKGTSYSLRQFLGASPPKPPPDKKLMYCVLYLSPAQYHRFHSPCDFLVLFRRHVSGEVFPVFTAFSSRFNNLFSLNERVILSGSWRMGVMYFILVAAFNVGGIILNFDTKLTTNKYNTRLRYSDHFFRRDTEVLSTAREFPTKLRTCPPPSDKSGAWELATVDSGDSITTEGALSDPSGILSDKSEFLAVLDAEIARSTASRKEARQRSTLAQQDCRLVVDPAVPSLVPVSPHDLPPKGVPASSSCALTSSPNVTRESSRGRMPSNSTNHSDATSAGGASSVALILRMLKWSNFRKKRSAFVRSSRPASCPECPTTRKGVYRRTKRGSRRAAEPVDGLNIVEEIVHPPHDSTVGTAHCPSPRLFVSEGTKGTSGLINCSSVSKANACGGNEVPRPNPAPVPLFPPLPPSQCRELTPREVAEDGFPSWSSSEGEPPSAPTSSSISQNGATVSRGSCGILIPKGDEMGAFKLGSTIVMLFEADLDFQWTTTVGAQVRVGEVIGRTSGTDTTEERSATRTSAEEEVATANVPLHEEKAAECSGTIPVPLPLISECTVSDALK